jgi:hypothetical protein
MPINNVTGPTNLNVQTIDTDGDGAVDQGQIKKESGSVSSFDSFNLKTSEGLAQFKQACLDMGVAVPEFVGASSSYVNSLSAENQSTLNSFGTSLTDPSAPASSELQSRWAEFVGKQAVGGGIDVNALVQHVLRDAYLENTQDLYFHASKVKYYNELKKSIRTELTKAREELAKYAGKEGTESVSYSKTAFSTDYTGASASGQPEILTNPDGDVGTKEGLETYIENLEEKLNSVGDDAQLANVDLQNMLQKQQQTMQMMSNISKMLHDTAMAVIRKIG